MRTRLRQIRRDERGMSFVFVGMGFMAFMAATTLAVDVGMFMTARSQAQNAADAGALAGAVALYFNDFNNRSAGGPVVQSAIAAAQANGVMGHAPSVLPADVTFPNDPSGQPTRVAVRVFRTTDRNNAIPTLIGPIFGAPTVSIGAAATAEASPANAETCVKPFTIPDRWAENQTGPWDPTDTFDLYTRDNAANGEPLATPDVYIPRGQPGYTGYNATRDKGLQLILKANNQDQVSPSFYNPWDLPGSEGADDYRSNIAGCNTAIIGLDALMTAEPGNMVGPTAQGSQDLYDLDPDAYWDTACNCVKGSAYGVSPRVAVIPVYDPEFYADGKHNGRNASLRVANYVGFFIEQMTGNEVTGRITPVSGIIDGDAGPGAGAFPVVIRLVQ